MMTARLIVAIISSLVEEVALVAIVLWGLPQLGINIPLPGLIALMVTWGVFSITLYQIGSRTLKKEPLVGLPAMIGSQAKIVTSLAPEGLVRIKGELWGAISISGTIEIGEEVTVVGQDALKLIVRKTQPEMDRKPVA